MLQPSIPTLNPAFLTVNPLIFFIKLNSFNVLVDKEKVYLLSIYDKSEQENISDEEIERLLDFIEEEEDLI